MVGTGAVCRILATQSPPKARAAEAFSLALATNSGPHAGNLLDELADYLGPWEKGFTWSQNAL